MIEITEIDSPDADRLNRLSYHIESGDYFPMLATVLGFVEESVQSCSCAATEALLPLEAHALKGARTDLMYLYKNYRLVPITVEAVEEN
jgi:hypothetical protein